MTYEQGFAQGERDAFTDRRAGLALERMPPPTSEGARGYEDGYTPRSATWWTTKRTAQNAESE
jgi:hypothetical protein